MVYITNIGEITETNIYVKRTDRNEEINEVKCKRNLFRQDLQFIQNFEKRYNNTIQG